MVCCLHCLPSLAAITQQMYGAGSDPDKSNREADPESIWHQQTVFPGSYYHVLQSLVHANSSLQAVALTLSIITGCPTRNVSCVRTVSHLA